MNILGFSESLAGLSFTPASGLQGQTDVSFVAAWQAALPAVPVLPQAETAVENPQAPECVLETLRQQVTEVAPKPLFAACPCLPVAPQLPVTESAITQEPSPELMPESSLESAPELSSEPAASPERAISANGRRRRSARPAPPKSPAQEACMPAPVVCTGLPAAVEPIAELKGEPSAPAAGSELPAAKSRASAPTPSSPPDTSHPIVEKGVPTEKPATALPDVELTVPAEKAITTRPALDTLVPAEKPVAARPALDTLVPAEKPVPSRPALDTLVPAEASAISRPALETVVPAKNAATALPALETPAPARESESPLVVRDSQASLPHTKTPSSSVAPESSASVDPAPTRRPTPPVLPMAPSDEPQPPKASTRAIPLASSWPVVLETPPAGEGPDQDEPLETLREAALVLGGNPAPVAPAGPLAQPVEGLPVQAPPSQGTAAAPSRRRPSISPRLADLLPPAAIAPDPQPKATNVTESTDLIKLLGEVTPAGPALPELPATVDFPRSTLETNPPVAQGAAPRGLSGLLRSVKVREVPMSPPQLEVGPRPLLVELMQRIQGSDAPPASPLKVLAPVPVKSVLEPLTAVLAEKKSLTDSQTDADRGEDREPTPESLPLLSQEGPTQPSPAKEGEQLAPVAVPDRLEHTQRLARQQGKALLEKPRELEVNLHSDKLGEVAARVKVQAGGHWTAHLQLRDAEVERSVRQELHQIQETRSLDGFTTSLSQDNRDQRGSFQGFSFDQQQQQRAAAGFSQKRSATPSTSEDPLPIVKASPLRASGLNIRV